MANLWFDFETRSPYDLKKCGIDRYAQDVDLLMMAYAFDEEPVELWEPRNGAMPTRVRAALLDPEVTKIAWNINFERTILRVALDIKVPLAQWFDVMVFSKYLGYPAALDKATKALHQPKHLAKDSEGDKLIKLFSKLSKATKPMLKKGALPTYYKDWTSHPAEWQKFGEYCKQDVVAERAAYHKLESFNSPFPASEMEAWSFDQLINGRGVYIDLDFTRNAYQLAIVASDRLAQEMMQLTGATKAAGPQINRWVNAQGWKCGSLDEASRLSALKDSSLPPQVRRLFELMQERAGTSYKKLLAALDRVSSNGRATHCLTYFGAHTGRWTSHGLQLQNMKKPTFKSSPEQLIQWTDAIRNDTLTDSPVPGMSLLAFIGDIIRSMVASPDGYQLLLCDLAQIEARVLAWVAGCETLLSAFREGRDCYREFMAKFLGKPPEEVTAPERALGKIVILGLGYRMGWKKFQDNALNKGGFVIGEEECRAIVIAYRTQYPEIEQFWRDIENHLNYSLEDHSALYVTDKFTKAYFDCTHPNLVQVVLPNGRAYHYPEPRFISKVNDYGHMQRRVNYTGFSKTGSRMVETHGGVLAENLVQSIARDVLLEGMLAAHRKGFKIVLTVHDEVIAEQPLDSPLTVQDLEACMTQLPAWADDKLPLKAEGFASRFYRK
jgi:DNA polymerase